MKSRRSVPARAGVSSRFRPSDPIGAIRVPGRNPTAVIEALQPLAESPEATGEAHFCWRSPMASGKLDSPALTCRRRSKNAGRRHLSFPIGARLGENGDLERAVKELRGTLALEPNLPWLTLPGADPAQLNLRDDALAALERRTGCNPGFHLPTASDCSTSCKGL